MKRLLLIIPLLFSISCETEEGQSNDYTELILGHWKQIERYNQVQIIDPTFGTVINEYNEPYEGYQDFYNSMSDQIDELYGFIYPSGDSLLYQFELYQSYRYNQTLINYTIPVPMVEDMVNVSPEVNYTINGNTLQINGYNCNIVELTNNNLHYSLINSTSNSDTIITTHSVFNRVSEIPID